MNTNTNMREVLQNKQVLNKFGNVRRVIEPARANVTLERTPSTSLPKNIEPMTITTSSKNTFGINLFCFVEMEKCTKS